MKRPALLEFKDVTVIKGRRKVLNSVSLSIRAGENAVILGPNGAGKSSFIKLITREYYPFENSSFRIFGREDWNLFELRHRIGVVSNDLQAVCSRDISGLETVLSGFFGTIGMQRRRVTPGMQKKAEAAMRFLEIAHLARQTVETMSSGEARRFLIARALIHKPKALILDEPMTSLDMRAAHEFRRVLQKIARSGTHIILVTHHLEDILPEIGRVILIREGRVLLDANKDTALTSANISRLFRVPVKVEKKDGLFRAWPSDGTVN